MVRGLGRFLVAGILIIAVLAGCGQAAPQKTEPSKAEPAPAPQPEQPKADTQKINYVLNDEASKLDPTITSETYSGPILTNVFEGLIRMDDNNQPQPGVATSWEISKDGVVYTFHLRDAKWSDGSPLTAKDFEYSFKRVMDPKVASEFSFMAYPYIKNGEKRYKGLAKEEDLGVKAVDDRTLKITLETPISFMLQILSCTCYFPVKKDVVEKDPEGWARNAATFISNGPFKIKEMKFGESITMVKNEHYWGKDKVRLEEIKFSYIPETATGLTAMEAGSVDGIHNVPTSEIPRLKSDPRFHVMPCVSTCYYLLNNKVKPLNDVRVRKALSLALDRKEIVENVLQAGQKPAFAIVPYGLSLEGQDFREAGTTYGQTDTANVAEAKKLLAEAGYPDGKGFPKLTLKYSTNPDYKKVSEAMQQMWKKNLNIDLELKTSEWKVYFEEVKKYDYAVAQMGWSGDYAHPMTFLEIFVTGNPSNMTNWASAQYDKAIRESKVEQDPKKSLEAMHKAEDILIGEMRILPVFHRVYPMMMAEYVKGWRRNVLGLLYFQDAYIEGRGK